MTPSTLALLLLLGGPAPLGISEEGFAVSPVTVNGTGPYLLVVDTAAGASALFPHLVEALGIDPAGGGRVSLQGASGRRQVAQHRIGPIETAGVRVDELSAVAIDSSHLLSASSDRLYGILGADFLVHFDVEMDFATGQMALSAPVSNAPTGATPFKPLFGTFLVIPVRVNGADVTAVVDTGARRSILNWRAARAAGYEPGDERLDEDEPVRGATTDRSVAWSVRADTLEAAGRGWKRPLLGISDLPVFAALGLEKKPAMIFGVNLLKGRLLRIDYDEKRLVIGERVASPQ